MKGKKLIIIAVVAAIAITAGVYFGIYAQRETGPVLWQWNGQEIYCVGGGPYAPHIESGYGIYGSEFKFAGAYPGATGTIPLIILNGKECDRTIGVFITQPDKLVDGYEFHPKEYYSWITTTEPVVNVTAGENYYIPMTLTIPTDTTYVNKNAEVGIFVKDLAQTGMNQIAYTQIWYIDIVGS